jgi:hypothetical protein
LDHLLGRHGLAPTGNRYAVLAYGSNACPGQLLEKDLDNVPVLFGRLHGAEAVYARRTTQRGYVPATLACKAGERSSWITLLTRERLAIMGRTEGRRSNTYALAELSSVRFTAGRRQFAPLYAYVNITGGVMMINGRPVGLRKMGQRRAKSLLLKSVEQDAAACLDFQPIAYPDPPAKYSQLVPL